MGGQDALPHTRPAGVQLSLTLSSLLPPPSSLQHSVSAAAKARVTGLSWSRPDPGLLLSADDSGALVVWDLLANTTRAVVFGRNTIFCLAAHPEVGQDRTAGLRNSLRMPISPLSAASWGWSLL